MPALVPPPAETGPHRWRTGPPVTGLVARIGRGPAMCRAVRVPILMYHRVTERPEAHPHSLVVERFRRQLALLRALGYRSVSPVDVATAILTRTPLPPRSIVFTFDDGYQDTVSVALPVLAEFGFSGTCYVVAGRIGQTCDWTERAPLMTWAEVQAWVDAGMDVGSHSMTHRDLTALSAAEARAEIVGSRAALEDGLGRPVASFVYPFNRVGRREIDLVAEAGYRAGCAGPELCSSVFALTRVSGASSLGWFALQLLPTYPEVRHLYRRIVQRREPSAALATWAGGLRGHPPR